MFASNMTTKNSATALSGLDPRKVRSYEPGTDCHIDGSLLISYLLLVLGTSISLEPTVQETDKQQSHTLRPTTCQNWAAC